MDAMMRQGSPTQSAGPLFDAPPAPPPLKFPEPDGESYNPCEDGQRLRTQHEIVLEIMSDGQWRTFDQIVKQIYDRYEVMASPNGVSARLRDLRKPKFGEHTVDKRRVEGHQGLFEYRVVVRGVS